MHPDELKDFLWETYLIDFFEKVETSSRLSREKKRAAIEKLAFRPLFLSKASRVNR